jgi:hypothetical protein
MQAYDLPRVAVISLAKREEEVFVPAGPDPIRLDRDSPGLHLLQRIRDEAHRFALGLPPAARGREGARVDLRHAAGRRSRRAARAAAALRLGRAVSRRRARRNWKACPGFPSEPRVRSTRNCTRQGRA